MLWNSSLDAVCAYARERLGVLRIALLCGLLALASLAGSPCDSWADGLFRLKLVVVFVCQFRLWDDLADRDRDRVEHPDRVLPRAASLWPFVGLLAGLAGLGLVLTAVGKPAAALVLLLGLNAAAFGWYHVVRGLVTSPLLGSAVVLLKYPVIVLLAAAAPEAPPGVSGAAAAGLAYVALCAYEVWHDPRLPRAPSPSPRTS